MPYRQMKNLDHCVRKGTLIKTSIFRHVQRFDYNIGSSNQSNQKPVFFVSAFAFVFSIYHTSSETWINRSHPPSFHFLSRFFLLLHFLRLIAHEIALQNAIQPPVREEQGTLWRRPLKQKAANYVIDAHVERVLLAGWHFMWEICVENLRRETPDETIKKDCKY